MVALVDVSFVTPSGTGSLPAQGIRFISNVGTAVAATAP